jgi:nitroreductase
MEIVPEIVARRSRRAIDPKPIPEETVLRLFEAASLAPSCSNNQPWRFAAIASAGKLAEIRDALTEGNAWGKAAPLIIAVATKPSLDQRSNEGRDYAPFDTGLAVQNLLLQAAREGLYAHPIEGFNPRKAREAALFDRDMVVIALVVVGYPGGEALLSESQKQREKAERERKPLAEIVDFM